MLCPHNQEPRDYEASSMLGRPISARGWRKPQPLHFLSRFSLLSQQSFLGWADTSASCALAGGNNDDHWGKESVIRLILPVATQPPHMAPFNPATLLKLARKFPLPSPPSFSLSHWKLSLLQKPWGRRVEMKMRLRMQNIWRSAHRGNEQPPAPCPFQHSGDTVTKRGRWGCLSQGALPLSFLVF